MSVKMSQQEIIEEFFNRTTEIVILMRGHGEEVANTVVVNKILRSLPEVYNPKVWEKHTNKYNVTGRHKEYFGSL